MVALVGRMQRQGLVSARGQEFSLTPEGERLALQVVRAHRLLERYFADEARLPLATVHAAAERREHSLSTADVERLSASLGHPTLDPHGDPIPDARRPVAPAAGTPATSWPTDTIGRIVHLEDEPQIAFAQIVAAGLRVGQIVRIIESTPERLVLTDGENEFRLAPAVAANVFLGAGASACQRPHACAWPISTDDEPRGSRRARRRVPGIQPAAPDGSRLHERRPIRAGAAHIRRRSARVRNARHARRAATRSGVAGARPAARSATRRRKGARTMMSHNCDTCASHAELARMGVKLEQVRPRGRARGQPEHRQVHAVQRADGPEAAHGQLARQDGDARRRRLRVQQGPLQARGPAGHLFAALGVAATKKSRATSCSSAGPTCTIVVVDATALERNLNLVLQVLEITNRVVVAVNLMDEATAQRHRGRRAQPRRAISACPPSASSRAPARGCTRCSRRSMAWRPARSTTKPLRVEGTPEFQRAVAELVPLIESAAPGVPNARWIAIRLLDGDAEVEDARSTSGRLARRSSRGQQKSRASSSAGRSRLQGAQ